MVSNPSDIAVNLESCIKNNCLENCDRPECELCMNCLYADQLQELHEAYREQTRCGGFKRVFPSKNHPKAEKISAKSQFLSKWFEAKCKIDDKWC